MDKTFDQTIRALEATRDNLEGFDGAVEMILNCSGRVIFMGIGKSGIVGQKIAATMASTGTPAYFVHPAEAAHGDLGMITETDLVILLSHSGETQEILSLLPYLNNRTIAITGSPNSALARKADKALTVTVEREACPNNLAPTVSTTVTMVLGDALAVALMQRKGFTSEQFARLHPGGTLGYSSSS